MKKQLLACILVLGVYSAHAFIAGTTGFVLNVAAEKTKFDKKNLAGLLASCALYSLPVFSFWGEFGVRGKAPLILLNDTPLSRAMWAVAEYTSGLLLARAVYHISKRINDAAEKEHSEKPVRASV